MNRLIPSRTSCRNIIFILLIEVIDNGIGMSPEMVAHLLNPAMKEKGGIGISNTNRRLIQLYGQGLSIDSKPGEGTIVFFVIPMK
ncbi:ATP-binding protein [Paenibacillus sp. FSL R10-2782]|uniref:sensor histidine kinase n=1 Tax=Paenibacillus sp. FSL R10-2782 TaxID=2954661 RepID=UPI003157F50D